MKTRLSHTLSGAICLWLVTLAVHAADSQARGNSVRPDLVPEAPPGDYVLQPMDVLRVQVFQEEDINKQGEVSISQEHTIVLPLIKTVSLKGKTVRQAEAMIRDLYDKDFIVNPQVSVIVLKYAERSVNVIGAVNSAGRIQFPQERGLTIVDAISLAGGQNRLSDLKRVKLTRKKPSGEVTTQEIDVDALMKRGGRDAVPLEKGDVIFVPERIL
jgi:polysaccharide export outer membrane protein